MARQVIRGVTSNWRPDQDTCSRREPNTRAHQKELGAASYGSLRGFRGPRFSLGVRLFLMEALWGFRGPRFSLGVRLFLMEALWGFRGPRFSLGVRPYVIVSLFPHGTPFQYSCLENPWMEEPGRL